jgi:hypothetical protein
MDRLKAKVVSITRRIFEIKEDIYDDGESAYSHFK